MATQILRSLPFQEEFKLSVPS